MKFVMLAARNLTRNLRRTLITCAAVALGLAMMIFTITLQTGSYDDMISKGISQLAGHVVVQAEGYQSEQESELVVTGASEVIATLQQAFPDAVIAPRTQIAGLLMSTDASVGAGVQGIDPAAEAQVLDLPDQVVEGEWLPADDPQAILIGEKMAEQLQVEIGDKLVYMGQHGGEDVASKLFRVRGVFRTGIPDVDGFVAYTNLQPTQELIAGEGGSTDIANLIAVHLSNPEAAVDATVEARALIGRSDVEVLSWRQAIPELAGMIELDRNSGDVMLSIIGLIVAMGVLNTVLMSVLERTREWGVMMAIGMKPRQMASVVLMEGTAIGAFGSAVGLLLGLLISWPIIAYGIDYAQFMGGTESMEMGGIAMSSTIHGALNWWRNGVYVAAAVLFTTLAAVYPAWHVARLKPVDAIHHT